MDQYTSDLLVKWGFLEYVSIFEEARIDITALQLIGESEIATLIGPIGDRLRFKSNLNLWKSELSAASAEPRSFVTSSPTVSVSLPDIPEINGSFVSSVLHELQTARENEEAAPTLTTEHSNGELQSSLEKEASNSVLNILRKSTEGRAIIAKGTKNNGLLQSELRKQLANIIIKEILENNATKVIQGSEFLRLAHEIRDIFPLESPAIFYAPYLAQTSYQAKRNASGILFNIYNTRKKRLVKLGVIPPSSRSRSHSRCSTSSTSDLVIPASGIQLSDLQQGDSADFEEDLNALESPDPGPWQDVERYWRNTISTRLRYLYYEKGTLNDYFNRFPILKSPSGYTLLLQDYEKLYPNNTNGITKLASSIEKIIQVATNKAKSTKDLTIKKKIQDYLDSRDEKNEADVGILLLPYVLNIPPVRRKGAWKPSRAEFRDGFVTNAATETEVRPIIAERRNKLSELGVTFQPLVIYCGDKITKNIKAFVVCEDVLYEFRSLNKAVDVAFKIFHATGAQYPQESYDVWLLLQVAFYDLNTQFDRQSSSLKQVLVDLGLKDNIK